jgi:hypothetical protein
VIWTTELFIPCWRMSLRLLVARSEHFLSVVIAVTRAFWNLSARATGRRRPRVPPQHMLHLRRAGSPPLKPQRRQAGKHRL